VAIELLVIVFLVALNGIFVAARSPSSRSGAAAWNSSWKRTGEARAAFGA
jgi:hypothetical protein